MKKNFRNGFRSTRSRISPVNRGREVAYPKNTKKKSERAQATIEYVLLIGAVVVVLTGVSTFFTGLMSESIKTFNKAVEDEIAAGNDNVIPRNKVWGL